MSLKIAKGLTLGNDAVTKTFAILAQRRKGKTYTASVMAEEMAKAKQPWVALDPTSAWWGLRSSADGKKAGLPVVIIGGEHGDLPLERGAGQVIADLVVDEPGWYVLDLGHLDSKNAEREFVTAFAERFYRRKAKSPDPVHLFVDEADMFVPQRSPQGDQRMLGAFEAIVRRGGIRGIGTTLISQRAAVVNKNVLEQIDALIVLRVVGPNDQKAIETYVKAQGDDDVRAELMGSLASLKLGEAWIWEPGAEPPLFERIQVRERDTFNSSATPKSGERKSEPRKLADVDLDALRGKIADTIERAKAEDPKELRKQISELRRKAAAAEKKLEERPTEPVEVEKPVEVPVLDNGTAKELRDFVEGLGGIAGQIDQMGEQILSELRRISKTPAVAMPPAQRRETRASAREAGGGRANTPPRPPAQPVDGDVQLNKKAERVALSVLLQHPAGLTTKQLAVISGYSASGGGFRNALGRLRTLGLISPAGQEPIAATDAAAEVLPEVEPLPTGRDLLDHWMGQLKKRAEREALQVIYDAYPDSLGADEIAEATGYEPTGGGFRNALGKLRTLMLIEGHGQIRASDSLFEEAIA